MDNEEALQTKINNELVTEFTNCFTPNDNRCIYEWANEHVTLNSGYAITGKFSVDISPHFKKIFDAYQDPYVREVNILAPPRSGKTLIAEISLLHTIANNSGDVLWLQLSDEKASQMSDLRMIPLIKSCKPVRELIDLNNKYNITEQRFKFLHSTVHVSSPKENTLNAVGYKYIFGDEVWKYKGQSIIKDILRRADDYKGVSKAMFFSQGGLKNGEWYNQFIKGDIYEYGWCCPNCKKLQQFYWSKQREDKTYSGIVWKNDSTTKDANGKWIIKECAKSAVLECHHCKYQVTDNPQNRKYLLDSGDYIKVQDGEDSTVKSFRFTNLCNIKISFAELVTRYLMAKQKKDSFGATDDLEHFITKDMADWWSVFEGKTRSEIRLGVYDTEQPFGEFEYRRFLTVDCQQKSPYFYYVVRAWTQNGESRLISFGTADTWNEIEAIRDRNRVDYRFCFVDTGDGTKQETILAEMVKRGKWMNIEGEEIWTCYNSLKGSGLKGFLHGDNKWYRYKEPSEYTVAANNEEDENKSVIHVTWSNYRIKQILETLRDGKGKKWEAANVTDEYTTHLNAELLQRKIKGNTSDFEYVCKPNTPNHYWDCECMQIVAADIYNCLNCESVNNNEDGKLNITEDN